MPITLDEIEKKVSHIPSTVYRNEVELWATNIPSSTKNILDVGTGHGRSASCLGLICPNALVRTIDWGDEYINGGTSEDEYISETKKYIKDAGADNVVFELVKYQDYEPDYEIDVLNVDVTATYEMYSEAMHKYVPKVRPGGLVFVHSYIHPVENGPRKAANDFVISGVLKIVSLAANQMMQSGILAPAVFIKL